MRLIILASLLASVTSCATFDRQGAADTLAVRGGLQRSLVKTDPFTLTTYSRLATPGRPVTIYIEGDGLAWLDRNRVSPDPTPRNPVALDLASHDRSANVAYLARPCQYTEPRFNPRCTEVYWTDRRFSEEVVASMNAAVEQIKRGASADTVHLVGYSGGGAVATLIAARRKDVASLRTVAGNLDHEAVNAHHGVSPMRGSLNPIDVAGAASTIPQLHFSGSLDTVVPSVIARDYAKRAANPACIQVVTVEGATHADGWSERWPDLLKMPVECRARP
ncbi:alpha/beta hydrolase [Magnetospirillum sp. 15-1]|uniref:alpha/beta hydrolase n=1 Tax=Magnetospirillum sp. 15-1 TaxID=1979370 RepID=UPI001F5B8318|nr:alpha/beta hydrolase [Magnetospirillum sp. 15-1]